MSIIGKKYIPSDNSYCVNLSYPQRDHRLAGTLLGKLPKETTIVSEPYLFTINSDFTEPQEYMFVNVEYNGDINRVLFSEQNIIE